MELVLFDLDGTLLDGSGLPAAMRATCAALAAGLPGVTAEQLVAANTAAWRDVWPDIEDDYMLGGRDGAELSREAWERTLAAAGDDRSDRSDLVDRAIAEWREQERAALRLYPDVLPALDALDAAGIRTGMVTNGSGAVQRAKLDAVGITGRLDPLIVSGEAGVKKPDPLIFELAVERAGVPAAATLFVGDNRWHDLPGAMATGIRTVWLDRDGIGLGYPGPEPDETICTLADLRTTPPA